VWIEGGWGVDALLGEQTRPHDDLDFGVRHEDVDRICEVLGEFDRTDPEWPSSFVLRDAAGRKWTAIPCASTIAATAGRPTAPAGRRTSGRAKGLERSG
jgi:lincosamide nucleotidyltransferase A/C/D/E